LSDKWDALEYGRKYDFSKPFFEQFKKLYYSVPQSALINDNIVNSFYCNSNINVKNCYLVTNSGYVENSSYANRAVYVKDSLDLYIVDRSELCYEDFLCTDSYKLFFSSHCHYCINSWFLYDCRNCKDCFGCSNLKNKQYYIFNQPYLKEKYFKKLKEFNLGGYGNLIEHKKRYREIYQKSIHRFAHIIKSFNCTGDGIMNSKNCLECFDIKEAEDCKFCNWGGYGLKDAYDCGPGAGMGELLYENIDTGSEGARNFFTLISWHNHNVEYVINCHSSHHLFGCVGLRHKQYCILNKQYTKKEYESLISKIKKQMNALPYTDSQGRVYKYGEFFPSELSPFAYNETIAQEYFPLTKEQALKQGYRWYDKPKPEYTPTLQAQDIPDNITDIDDSILKEVIACANEPNHTCQGSGVFRLIPPEYEFYQKHHLPIPRLCPDCRHQERIKQRNPMKLWHRQCMCAGRQSDNRVYQNQAEHFHKSKPCPNEFETTYAPDRPEIVYCETCYQKEVE